MDFLETRWGRKLQPSLCEKTAAQRKASAYGRSGVSGVAAKSSPASAGSTAGTQEQASSADLFRDLPPLAPYLSLIESVGSGATLSPEGNSRHLNSAPLCFSRAEVGRGKLGKMIRFPFREESR